MTTRKKPGHGKVQATGTREPASKKHRPRLLFYLGAAAIPFLLLFILEASLRLFGYGDHPALFVSTPDEQSKFYGINLDIGKRYFSQIDFTPTPRKDLFLKEKPENGYRIFVLGGSTTAGFPYGNNLTFPRILQRRLLDTFPDRHIEVVNTAMSAISSYTLLDFMDEILEQEPDAILIYAGHNEYYGGLGVGSVESLGMSPSLVTIYLKMQRLRTFQLIRDVLRPLQSWFSTDPGENDATATTMARIVKEQTIPLGSKLFQAGKEQFRRNLRQIFTKAGAAGIPIIASELVCNTADQAPFVSVETDSLPSAMSLYEKANALANNGRYEEAREAYYRAKDLDALRFRAPEDFNHIIHELAKEYDAAVVPMQSYFENASPNGLVGSDLMHEHVHPNIDGYFLMADAFYQTMRSERLISPNWLEGNIKPARFYRRDWGYTELDSLYGQLSILQLKGGWPFKKTSGPNLALEQYDASTKLDSITLQILKTEELTLETGHLKLAEFYKSRRDFESAFKEYRALTYIVPTLDLFYRPAVELLMATQQYERAVQLLESSLRFNESVFAQKWLGQLYLIHGETLKGISFLEKARESSPKDTQILYNLGRAFFNISDRDRGNAVLSELQKIAPGSPDAVRLEAFKSSSEKGASDVAAYLKQAQEHLQARRLNEALSVLHQSLKVRETAVANELVGEVLLVSGKPADAISYLERARQMKQTADAKLLYNLSSAYFLNARHQEAWDTFTEVKQIYPDFPDPGNLEVKLKQALGY